MCAVWHSHYLVGTESAQHFPTPHAQNTNLSTSNTRTAQGRRHGTGYCDLCWDAADTAVVVDPAEARNIPMSRQIDGSTHDRRTLLDRCRALRTWLTLLRRTAPFWRTRRRPRGRRPPLLRSCVRRWRCSAGSSASGEGHGLILIWFLTWFRIDTFIDMIRVVLWRHGHVVFCAMRVCTCSSSSSSGSRAAGRQIDGCQRRAAPLPHCSQHLHAGLCMCWTYRRGGISGTV